MALEFGFPGGKCCWLPFCHGRRVGTGSSEKRFSVLGQRLPHLHHWGCLWNGCPASTLTSTVPETKEGEMGVLAQEGVLPILLYGYQANGSLGASGGHQVLSTEDVSSG